MITVRLRDGKKVKLPDAEYVVNVGGQTQFLNGRREVVAEYSWAEVVAYTPPVRP